MHAGENDRRLAGVGGRCHPGIDAEVRRQHHTLPVERRRDALPVLAPGGDEGRDRCDQDQTAQRIGIACRKARRRPSGPKCAGLGKRALDMRAPQRERIGVRRRNGKFVGDRRRRPMANTAAAIEPAQPSTAAGTRSARNGTIAASARIAKADRPAARASGGSQSQSPSHDTVRNNPMTVTNRARAGHSRSQKIVQRARRTATPSCDRAAVSALRSGAAGWFDGVSVTKVSARKSSPDNTLTRRRVQGVEAEKKPHAAMYDKQNQSQPDRRL